MSIEWDTLKDIFYFFGSLAGVIALSKPVFESKFNRDKVRFEYLSTIINEKMFLNLEPCIWDSRMVPSDIFNALDRFFHEVEENIDELRFSGPLKKWYKDEVTSICNHYRKLRTFVQVPQWEPYEVEHSDGYAYYWKFNKSYFTENGEYKPYDKHLSEAGQEVELMKESYQRMQIIHEMHFYESLLAKIILPRRFESIKT